MNADVEALRARVERAGIDREMDPQLVTDVDAMLRQLSNPVVNADVEAMADKLEDTCEISTHDRHEAAAMLRQLAAQTGEPVALRLLQEGVDLCALGDVDEDTEALGWGDWIRECKALLAHPPVAQPTEMQTIARLAAITAEVAQPLPVDVEAMRDDLLEFAGRMRELALDAADERTVRNAAALLRQLAAQTGEPVAWIRTLNGKPDWSEDCLANSWQNAVDGYGDAEDNDRYDAIPLYAHPPVAQPLAELEKNGPTDFFGTTCDGEPVKTTMREEMEGAMIAARAEARHANELKAALAEAQKDAERYRYALENQIDFHLWAESDIDAAIQQAEANPTVRPEA